MKTLITTLTAVTILAAMPTGAAAEEAAETLVAQGAEPVASRLHGGTEQPQWTQIEHPRQ